MEDAVRTYQFTMMIEVEPGHVAHRDPEWAADAAASALTDVYGITAFYGDIEPLGGKTVGSLVRHADTERGSSSHRFTITFHVGEGETAYDDPEWAADAAHGSLTNEYGIETVYTRPRVVSWE
jgi:hypothetical protein